MSKVAKLGSFYTPGAVFEELLEEDGEMAYAVVAVAYKDGSQKIVTSHCTIEQRAYLKCLFDAWVADWFDLDGG